MRTPMSPDRSSRLTGFFHQVQLAPTDRPPEAEIEVALLGGVEEGIRIAPDVGESDAPPACAMDEDDVAQMLHMRRERLSRREETVMESFRAPSGAARITDESIANARVVVAKLQVGEVLNPDELNTLEEVILPGQRPVVDIIHGGYTVGAPPFDFLDRPPYRTRLETAFRSIGRIELPRDPARPFGGTGFFIGDGLLLTNRHVALLFAGGLGSPRSRTIAYRAGGARIDMGKEVTEQNGIEEPPVLLEVTDVLLIHPYWDAAFLSVRAAGDAILPPPLTLASALPEGPLGARYVAAIGYPQKNPYSNVKVQDQEFRGIYGRKRLLPGLLGKQSGDERIPFVKYTPANRPAVMGLAHDCSTLTGNSGSAILNVETGFVVGLHFAGEYLNTNWAVPAWELAQDPYFRGLGIAFDPAVPPEPPQPAPAWASVWSSYPDRSEPAPKLNTGPANPVIAESLVSPGVSISSPGAPAVWYEQTDDAGIAAALRDDLVTTAGLLSAVLPADEVEALIAELGMTPVGEPSAESVAAEESFLGGLFGREADPNLPEIVFLHGIMGGHLARVSGLGGRLWVNPLAFLAGDLAEKLQLGADGLSDAVPGQVLRPDGMIRMSYANASRTWRRSGFVVNEFSYDWRKPIELLAESLARFIEELALQRPGKMFCLVAHSMGGVVSALYAARHKEWDKRIASAVLIGSPLHGSYAPMQAVLGTYDFVRKLAFVSRNDSVRDFQVMAATLSGLIDMLPDPDIFENARSLYKTDGWPDQKLRPAQPLLKESRDLKRKTTNSPLLAKSFLIVSTLHPTVANLFGMPNTKGDGTVPARSAAASAVGPEGVRGRFVATLGHGELCQEEGVIAAVESLIRSGTCSLPPLDLPSLLADDTLSHEEAVVAGEEAVSAFATDAPAVRERFRTGSFTQQDWNWLTKGA